MYKIDRTNLKKERNFKVVFGFVGIVFALLFIAVIVLDSMGMFSENSKNNPIVALLFVLFLFGIFIFIGIDGVKKYKEKMAKYDYLEQHGRLERGLKYNLVRTGTVVNGRPIMKIVVDYEMDSGSIIQLSGDGRYDHRIADSDGLVDLLIDPYDPSNYYLDYYIAEEY